VDEAPAPELLAEDPAAAEFGRGRAASVDALTDAAAAPDEHAEAEMGADAADAALREGTEIRADWME
jgi:hypothetical protein